MIRSANHSLSESPSRTRIALLIVTSERKAYLNLLLLSLRLWTPRPITQALMVDTSATDLPWHGETFLSQLAGRFRLLKRPGESLHMVLREAWVRLADEGVTHVLMLEEDFVLLRTIQLNALAELADTPNALQVVLPRQRWFEPEYDFRDRREYLRSRWPFISGPTGDRIQGYFTNNPHVMRLVRIIPLLEDVPPSDAYTFEADYSSASLRRELYSLQVATRFPWVWHIGAATPKGVRTAIASGTSTRWIYIRAHGKRSLVSAGRLAKAVYGRWRT